MRGYSETGWSLSYLEREWPSVVERTVTTWMVVSMHRTNGETKARCIRKPKIRSEFGTRAEGPELALSIRGGSHDLGDCDVQKGSKSSMGL
ncbi:hypothetical protein ACFX13_000357 [Malus domestica]